MYANNLDGSLSPLLGSLSQLSSLALQDNSFTGSVPDSFASLTALTALRLHGNSLQSTYPSALCIMIQLASFTLTSSTTHQCMLPSSSPTFAPTLNYGQLEDSFFCNFIAATDISVKAAHGWQLCSQAANFKCTWDGVICIDDVYVIMLDLSNRDIYGTIPSSIGFLSKLFMLALDRNKLYGTIPTSIGSLVSVTRLSLYKNSLGGSLPTSVGRMSDIHAILLYENVLTGSLPLVWDRSSRLQGYNCS